LWLSNRDPAFLLCINGRQDLRHGLSTLRTEWRERKSDLQRAGAQQFIDELSERVPEDPFRDEVAHRTEHSIEFQVLFLQHLWPSAKIVPILCGGFRDAAGRSCPPDEAVGLQQFIAGLRQTLQATNKRTCVLASVDFSHLGGRFGDRLSMTPAFLGRVEREDRGTLAAAEALDADAFYRSATSDDDRRHIDATPAVYVLLKAMDLTEGRLLKYDQSVERETESVVSFASMVFR